MKLNFERGRSFVPRSLKTVGQLGSPRSSFNQPAQLPGPRARISQGREERRPIMTESVFVGIDVSQTQFDVALRPGRTCTVPHEEAGMATVVEEVEAVHPT